MRDEVTEQLAQKSPSLTALATDWRKLLFPEANDQQFADGYAQAVTFGLLMARSSNIRLADGLDQVGKQLGKTNSLIGAALRLLTDEVGNEATLKTSLGTLVRVLDTVNWHAISKGNLDAWLYFYEDFLEVYDNALRKLTGSYYTPPEVVGPMIRLVDDVLRRHFGRGAGLASTDVTLADPAVGTGTFILGVLRRMPDEMEYDEASRRLLVGKGFIENVPPAVWNYEVSGKRVLTQWFSYRKKHRERPIMGDRRRPSKLGEIQPDHWLAEYTTELLNVLNVLALLVEQEPEQAKLLEAICAGSTLDV